MDNRPLVSIIINNYNYAQFLEEAIASALAQTYPNVEVILVDDGSTDSSSEIIALYSDRLKPIFKKNGGQASTFNVGFAASRGEIICFLDSDDTFLPNKIAEIVDVFTTHTDVEWCFHAVKMVDYQTNNLLGISEETGSRRCDFRKMMKKGRLSFFAPPTSGLCFKKSLLQQILPMTETLKRGADRYLVAIAPALSPGFYLDRQLSIQKIHGNNGNTLQEGEKFNIRRAYKVLNVAYFMKRELPQFYKITDRIFARGLGLYWQTGYQRREEKELIIKYLSSSNLLSKIRIYLLALYRNKPWKTPRSAHYKQKVPKIKI